jgi:hypothetical protein
MAAHMCHETCAPGNRTCSCSTDVMTKKMHPPRHLDAWNGWRRYNRNTLACFPMPALCRALGSN